MRGVKHVEHTLGVGRDIIQVATGGYDDHEDDAGEGTGGGERYVPRQLPDYQLPVDPYFLHGLLLSIGVAVIITPSGTVGSARGIQAGGPPSRIRCPDTVCARGRSGRSR